MSMLTCYPYYWSSEEEDMYAELLDSEHKRLGMDSSPKPVRRTHDSDGAPIDPKRYAYSVRRPESEGQDGALQPLLQNRIPIEIFYEILVHLHPRDLLALRKSSNHFRCYTDPCRRSWIWARARANAPVPIPDPPCVSVGKDMWNEEAYASFLFTTENGCNMCGKFTNRLPISFAARIYICDSEICFNTFIDDVTDTPEELIPPEKWMLMQSWMPTLEPELHPPTFGYEVGTPLYSRRGLECSVGEWERSERRSKGAPGDGWVPFSCDAPRTLPKLLSVYSIREELLPHMMKVSSALQAWGPRFVRHEEEIKEYNNGLAAQLSWEVSVPPSILLQSQIYQDHIRWASTSGRRMSYVEWTQIRDAVRVEIVEMAARVASGFFEGAFE